MQAQPARDDWLSDAVGIRGGRDCCRGPARGDRCCPPTRRSPTAGGSIRGPAFIRLGDIPQNTPATLTQIAQRHGAELVPISETWTESGISLGSGRVASLKSPRVLLAWDAPTSSLSAGWARFALERRFGQRVTAVRASTLQNFNMANYDVLVLPSGAYTFSEDALRRLRDWIRNGGTLITLAEASRWAARIASACSPLIR